MFHPWRSFNFDENTETKDAYFTQIRQVGTLLGYGEPQILEVFKNTLPTKLYWMLFPIEDLRQAVETAKRILTKEKLDKQLTGQTSTRDGTTTFLPLDSKVGGQISLDRPNVGQLLTREQANYVYKKVEIGKVINTDTIL